MTAYNINNVARLMNEDGAKYNRKTGKFEKNEEFMPGENNSPSIPKNVQPVKFERNADGKTVITSRGSGKGKGKAKGNPFAKKDGKKGNPFAKKAGKKANPFAKGGSVEESIDRLLHLLEFLDPEKGDPRDLTKMLGAARHIQNSASEYSMADKKRKRLNGTQDDNRMGSITQSVGELGDSKRARRLAANQVFRGVKKDMTKPTGNVYSPKSQHNTSYTTPPKVNINTGKEKERGGRTTTTGRGYGATSSANRVFQNDENNRLKPYLDGLVRVADEIQDPSFSPKNTQNLLQKLQFLGNMVKEIENNSHRFNVRPLREVLNKYANLAQAYEFITKNPPHKIQTQMKQDPKNQAHYQKMLDYVNQNMNQSQEFTRYKDLFTGTFTRFIDDEGLRGD